MTLKKVRRLYGEEPSRCASSSPLNALFGLSVDRQATEWLWSTAYLLDERSASE
jgi:hypothetical protein